jgi:aminopeptidase YwaD
MNYLYINVFGVKMKKIVLSAFLVIFFCSYAFSQEKNETVLDNNLLRILINETSGALQLKNLRDIGSYESDRMPSEYNEQWREIKYICEKAKEYGFSEIKVEKWKSDSKIWDGEVGELWMVEPEKRLLISYRDEVASLAPNSIPGEYESEMVFVGKGTSLEDYKNIDVAGKIVLGEGNLGSLYRFGVQKFKAKGVISFNTHHPFDNPDKILCQSLPSFEDTKLADSLKHYLAFGFSLSPRLGKELSDLYYKLRDSKAYSKQFTGKIVLKAVVKANYREYYDQLVSATIPGDGSCDEEINLSAHLFEGIQKQGANDDFSGCVTLLETGRTLIKLIKEGAIAKPSRTIRFIWVPEISGSFWYLAHHKDIADKTRYNINLDMVGEDTHKNLNSLVFYQNLHSRAHWIDDATEDLLEWVNKNCSERLETRGFSYGYQIFDPIGTRHPFYYNIEPWSSGSDHIIFQMQYFKIPSVFFNNWPDVNYHTSFDRPEFADATELRRIGVISSSLALLGSSTKDVDYYKVGNIVYGKILQRLGKSLSKEMNNLHFAPEKNIDEQYRDSRYIMQAHTAREISRLKTLNMFITNSTKNNLCNDYINTLAENIENINKQYLTNLDEAFKSICKERNLKYRKPDVTNLEKKMDDLIPEDVAALKLDPETKEWWKGLWGENSVVEGLSSKYYSELKNFVNGKNSILDIRNLVSAEYEPISLEPTLKYFEQLEKTKYLKLKKK